MKTKSNKLITVLATGLLGGTLAVAASSLAFDWPLLFKAAAKNSVQVEVSDTPVARDTKLTTSFAPIVKHTAPSVVSIFTTKTVRQNPELNPFFNDPIFRQFFGDQFGGRRLPREFKERGLGSGVIVSKDGYILTNNHVVDGADEIKIALTGDGKKEYTAKVVGRDPRTDIAVLKIDADDLHPATFTDSDKVEVGDVVLALGNPFGIGQTVTMGIVSAVRRGNLGIEDYEDFIQTDASINPGNSGGALVDIQGRLVGINTAILSRTGGNAGIGFAVPANLARNIMERIVEHGKVVRGYLGVMIQDLTADLAKRFGVPSDTKGVVVSEVTENSAASEAGIQNGDIILELNDKPVQDARQLRFQVAQYSPDTKVNVKVLRQGSDKAWKEKTLKATLKELPAQLGGPDGSGSDESGGGEALQGVGVSDLTQAVRQELRVPAYVKGALVTEVDPNSAAYEAGLREGDIIQEINRRAVENADQAVKQTKNLKDKQILLRIWSKGGSRYMVVDETKK